MYRLRKKLIHRALGAAVFLALAWAAATRVATHARGDAELVQITGHFDIVGSSPDGDSIRFYPDEAHAWSRLKGRPIRANRRAGAQVRLEGVDALETHYAVKGYPKTRQPQDLGDAATAALLSHLGFTNVQWSTSGSVVSTRPSRTPGYVLAHSSDAYGRCVGFVFAGAPSRHDGPTAPELDEIRRSANHKLLAQGLVYPAFYTSLPPGIRTLFSTTVQATRRKHQGVWKKDVTAKGLQVTSVASLERSAYIFPKLYRRLLEHLARAPQDTSLVFFQQFLENKNDRILMLPEHQRTTLAELVQVGNQGLRLRRPLEDLVFQD